MASNVINTGLNLMNTAYNGAGGIVLSGDAVKGGYFVTDILANIPSWSRVTGTLCYCTTESKFYQYNGTDWVEKLASSTEAGFMSPADKSKLDNIAAVATSGSYNDLNNKPEASLTIQKNGIDIDTFSVNSTSDKTIDITVPTGAAADKDVDTSIPTASTSTNLPTSKAVAEFVEGKGYKTTDNNTTYSLSKSGTTITLTGSDGSTTSVTDADTNTTYDIATSSTPGLVKIGYTQNNKNYPVELSDGKMFVNVPWTDTNAQDGNDNQTVKTGSVTFGANDIVEFVAGANVTITGNAINKTIEISAADSNTCAVTSVAGKTGAVTLDKSDVGLDNIINTSDSAKPVSGGTTKFTTGGAYTELAKKVDKTTTVNGHILDGNVIITKSDIGLTNVEDKASAEIRSEITSENVTGALGYTPLDAAKAYVHPESHPVDMITGLANVATSGNYTDLSNTPTTLPANGGNADTVDGKHAEDFVQSVKIGTTECKSGTTVTLPEYPTALKNPSTLTIGGKSYDGSSAISVTAADLGIANALHFIGETTTDLTDGTTTAVVTISGVSKTPVSGDVVLYGSKEFIWNGEAWKELGDGSSHALKTHTIIAGNGLTGGGQIGNNPTLNVGAGNGITVTANQVAAKAGSGITVDANGIHHATPESVAACVISTNRTYVSGVTVDTYGHVTSLTTGTETVTDTNDNQTIKGNGTAFGVNEAVDIVGDGATTVTADTTNKKITISSADTHNSHAVISGTKVDGSTPIKGSDSSGDITLGDSGVTAGEYGPTSNQTPSYGAAFNVPDIKVNAKGIVTSVVNRTVTIPASDNTDTQVTSTADTSSQYYLTGSTSSSTTTGTLIKRSDVYVNTSGQLNAPSYNATSDARLKENFEPFVIEKSILDLPTYKFDFIDGAKNQIGCKAQDLQEICPEIVVENNNGYLSIQESKIVYLLLEEVKKLKAEIEILKNKD